MNEEDAGNDGPVIGEKKPLEISRREFPNSNPNAANATENQIPTFERRQTTSMEDRLFRDRYLKITDEQIGSLPISINKKIDNLVREPDVIGESKDEEMANLAMRLPNSDREIAIKCFSKAKSMLALQMNQSNGRKGVTSEEFKKGLDFEAGLDTFKSVVALVESKKATGTKVPAPVKS